MPKGVYLHKPSPRKGISLPEEIKRKISEGMKGKKNALGKHFFLSEEAKRKISERQRGRKLPEETKRKMSLAQKERYKDGNERMKTSLAMKGTERSEETRRKLSLALKGKHISPKTEFKKGHEVSAEIRKKISLSEKGRKLSEEHKRKIIERMKTNHPRLGKYHTKESKEKLRNAKIELYKNNYWLKTKISNSVKKLWQNPEYRQAHTGPNHPWWKGGITKREETLAHALRVELRNWTKEVLERDNYTCQECGKKFNKKFLQVHHIKPISQYPSLALDVSNGITLCKNCHLATESYGRKLEKNTKILLNTEKRQFINKISNNS